MKRLLAIAALAAVMVTATTASFAQYGMDETAGKWQVGIGTFKATADMGGSNKYGYSISGDYTFKSMEKGELFAGVGYTAYQVKDIPVLGGTTKADVSLPTCQVGYRFFLTPEQKVYVAPAAVLAYQYAKVSGVSDSKTKVGGNVAIGARFAGKYFGEFYWNFGADDVFRGWGLKGGMRF